MHILSDFKFEIPLWKAGLQVLGIDEAGRGAFAGPLAVAGVLFDKIHAEKLLAFEINDSKLLSEKKRELLFQEITTHALFSHVELIDLSSINTMGIGRATTLGMQRVYEKAAEDFQNLHMLIDAFSIPGNALQTPIVKGDRVSVSIAAASILAKVTRDRHMKHLAREYSQYGWDKNKGYGTADHRNALGYFGATAHHRTKFIRKYL